VSREIGLEGEREAARYLKKKGYAIITKNFRAPGGEVDIIARDGKTLVFVEVKTRKGGQFGEGHWAVDARKRKHLTLAAMAYLVKKGIRNRPCRFDLVVLDQEAGLPPTPRFELIKNAFDAEFQEMG
jgi:putative endonuclease